MAVPARRVSKTRKRTRSANKGLEANKLIKCSNCGADIRPHRVCSECGFYKGKDVINKDNNNEEKKEA